MSEFNPLLQVGICEEIGESAADIDNLLAELGAQMHEIRCHV